MTSKLTDVWLQASSDLGIEVTAPMTVTSSSGESFVFEVAIHEFGSKHGMLLMEQWNATKAKVAAELGYGYSCIAGDIYERQSTIEVLRDWGWSSANPAPAWLAQQAVQLEVPDADRYSG